MTSKIKKLAGVATVAAALGATALTAAPAQAQSFHFGINSGNNHGPSFSFGVGNDHRYPNYRPGRYCLSANQLENRIERQGYHRVRITDAGRFRTSAVGVSGRWLYRLTVDSCSGAILDRDRLRRA
jgi:hypothetical protein